jgi:hypothetical protein
MITPPPGLRVGSKDPRIHAWQCQLFQNWAESWKSFSAMKLGPVGGAKEIKFVEKYRNSEDAPHHRSLHPGLLGGALDTVE